MPRYRAYTDDAAAHNTLPLDTVAVIIPRQSKKAGARLNINSQELADHELMDLATSQGFVPNQVRIDKRDMGISANTTTINDRPALREWLRELLPAGISKVVVFSQEDRAFRDEEEIELNTFIHEVKKHRGWVICGHKVYRLWEEYDADMFRMMCKYAAKYIVHHVRGRLLPSVTRAAQRGLYDGRGINIGYIVDYDSRSLTYKHYIPYPPHATLVLQEIFERFAHMPYPSVPALVRAWNVSNGMDAVYDAIVQKHRVVPKLYFPLLPPEIDERVLHRQSWGRRRVFPPYGVDDPLRRGWLLREQGARRILSNVFYLGWVVRDGIIIRGERSENRQVRIDPKAEPLVLHDPLVLDSDLFWYCFERVSAYTIDGVPNPKRRYYTRGIRQRDNEKAQPSVSAASSWHTTLRNAETSTLLLQGKIHCSVHGHLMMRFRRRPDEEDRYQCKHYDDVLGHRQNYCMQIPGREIDDAVVAEFLLRLELNDDDVQGIARAWQLRQRKAQAEKVKPTSAVVRSREIEQAMNNLVTGISLASSDVVRQRLVAEIETLNAELEFLHKQTETYETELVCETSRPVSAPAFQVAKQAAKMLTTLRARWKSSSLVSRQALMQWCVESVSLAPGRDDRKLIQAEILWRGGQRTAVVIMRKHDRRQVWNGREQEIMRLWYSSAEWRDLYSLLPGRSRESMSMYARRHGLSARSPLPSQWCPVPGQEFRRLAPPAPHRILGNSSLAHASAGKLPSEMILDMVAEFNLR